MTDAQALAEPMEPPGPESAVDEGCLCPVLINGPGTPPEQRLVAPDCDVHTVADGVPGPVR